MQLIHREFLPDALFALPTSSLRTVLQRWVARALRCWVIDCLYVTDCSTTVALLRSLPTDDVIDLGLLVWLLHEANDACVFDDAARQHRLTVVPRLSTVTACSPRSARLARRALSACISDAQFLEDTLDERDAVQLLQAARATVSIGLEQLQVASELLSPAVVAFERRRRALDVAAALRMHR